MSLRLTLICNAATQVARGAAFPDDEPLTSQGVAAASALAARLPEPVAAWTSPALRAVQTAAALGLAASIEPALADLDLGHWKGRTPAEIEAVDPSGVASWLGDPRAAPHGGESLAALLERTAHWLGGFADHHGPVIAVTHPAVIRAAVVAALDAAPLSFWRIDVVPLSFTMFSGRAGRWTLRALGQEPGKA
jgi:broad specificity phosphatase PhoE